MIILHIEAPYASFRKSYARSFGETYLFPPPATIYGMLLSLVGERLRVRHTGVQLAFAYLRQPRVATTLRKLSRFKYGVPAKQSNLGNAPDFLEVLCGIDFLCWIDSSGEENLSQSLEMRVTEALNRPEMVERTGVLCLGLSDDAVNEVSLVDKIEHKWHWLTPCSRGQFELPIWVDHVGAFHTRWQRYNFDEQSSSIIEPMPNQFTQIIDPR